MFVRLTQSMLIITDRDHTGGIICGDKNAISGTVVSKGYLDLLTDMFFEQSAATSLRDFSSGVRSRGLHGVNDNLSSAQRIKSLIKDTHGINSTRNRARFSAASTKTEANDGFILINGQKLWRPAGKVTTRKIGRSKVVLVEANQSLAGTMDPISDILIAGAGRIGPGLGVTAASCGACGLCGLCGLCGELNALSAVAAVTAVSALATVTFDPEITPDLTVRDIQERGRREVGEVLDATAALGRLANLN